MLIGWSDLPGFAHGTGAVEGGGGSAFAERRRLVAVRLAAVVVVAYGRRQREPVVIGHLLK